MMVTFKVGDKVRMYFEDVEGVVVEVVKQDGKYGDVYRVADRRGTVSEMTAKGLR